MRRINVGGNQGRGNPLLSRRAQRIALAGWPWALLLACCIAVLVSAKDVA